MVGIGFANTSLHLNGQVKASLQPRRRLQLICPLYFLQIFKNDRIR